MVLRALNRLSRGALSASARLLRLPACRLCRSGGPLLLLRRLCRGRPGACLSRSCAGSAAGGRPPAPSGGFVLALRGCWSLLLLYGEVLCFYGAAWNCSWPTRSGWQTSLSSTKIFHVALIADPQLTDRMSYGQEGLALWLTQFYSDYYMLRSERALRFVNRPDAYFVLGDLLDGGRELDGAEWESELRRFVSVFPAAAGGGNGTGPSCHVIAGNHDFGLGDGTVAEARSRFRAFFGPTTRRFDAANHTVVVVDSAALAGRASDCDWESAEASDAEVEVQELLAEIASDESSDPRRRILLTHIPLYRPPTATCGPLRRHGTTISNSQGYQWQNLLGVKCSRKILDMVKPAIVFSGDDHDFCEQRHPVQGLPDAVEWTIPTFSFLQGNFQPYTGYLSLNPSPAADDGISSWAMSVCPMVQQFAVYGTYAAFLAATALCVCAKSVMNRSGSCSRRRHLAYRRLPDESDVRGRDDVILEEVTVSSPVDNGGASDAAAAAFSVRPGEPGIAPSPPGGAPRDACCTLLRIVWPPLLLYFVITLFWWTVV